MAQVEVTYTGNGNYDALCTRNGKRVAVDCPMTKGDEFGPDSLLAAGLGSCMLISMAHFADRHDLDLSGTRADVDLTLGGKPDMRITGLEVTVRVPTAFSEKDRIALEQAAGTCPIKHSFRPDTEIVTHFEFGKGSAQAA